VLLDAQMDQTQRQFHKLDFDTLDMPAGKFIFAGAAWEGLQAGTIRPEQIGVSGPKGWESHGCQLVQIDLLADCWALSRQRGQKVKRYFGGKKGAAKRGGKKGSKGISRRQKGAAKRGQKVFREYQAPFSNLYESVPHLRLIQFDALSLDAGHSLTPRYSPYAKICQ
jgi:hypothetical protein